MPQQYSEMLADYLLEEEETENIPLPPKEKAGKAEKNGRKSPKGSNDNKNGKVKDKKEKKSKQGSEQLRYSQ